MKVVPGRRPASRPMRHCRANILSYCAIFPVYHGIDRSSPARGSGCPPFPGEALIAEMERIPEPAVLYLPGGRIAAVNRAAARLADIRAIGQTVDELVGHYETRRSGGSPLLRADLPCVRALRGEVVEQGEHIDMLLPDGSVYRALVTSSPVIVDGKVMGALSVWYDFDAYVPDPRPAAGTGGRAPDG